MVTFESEPRRHFGDEEEEEEKLEAKMMLLKEEGEEGPAAADEEEDDRGEEDEHGARHHQEEEEEEDETKPLQPPTPAPRDIVDGNGFDPGDGGGNEGSRAAEKKKETCVQNCSILKNRNQKKYNHDLITLICWHLNFLHHFSAALDAALPGRAACSWASPCRCCCSCSPRWR